MLISFYSVDNQGNKTFFRSEGKYEKEQLVFLDKSAEDTFIFVRQISDKLIFERKGKIEMVMELQEGAKTSCNYKNDMGLEFVFEVLCKMLLISKNKIEMEYDMILDGEMLSNHKIKLIIH